MIVLHGIWGRAEDSKWYFYLWGEISVDYNDKLSIIKQRFSFRHPFNASCEELHKIAKVTSSFSTIELVLPTFMKHKKPQPSTILLGQKEYGKQLLLNKWIVDCLVIDSADAMIYLKNIDEHLNNRDISYGDDLIYWSEVTKFSLDLLIKQRFIPSVKFSEHLLHYDNRRKYLATWIPIITDIQDSQRLKLLEDSMPPVCRALDSRILPRQLLLSVLESLIDGSIRRFLQHGREKIINDIVTKKMSDDYHVVDIEWLKTLLSTDMEINSSEKSIENLVIELNRWSEAVSSHVEGRKFITCFRLEPPELDGGNSDNNNDRYHKKNKTKWKLNYLLQALDDPSLVIKADEIWKDFKGKKDKNEGIGKYLDRRFQHPQDRLLKDLAIASRLFKPIERSLKLPAPSGCLIDVKEANSFLTESVWLLRESGYVILLPSWWNDKQSSLGVAITLKLKSKSKSLSGTTGMNLFGMNSLLDFDWRFAIGDDMTITKSEFMKLVSLKSPIVNFRGQWINLRKEYVESTLKLLEHYKKNGGIPFGEALSFMINRSSGENFSQFKFEYHEKEIEEIFYKLTSNDASLLDVLHQPDGFNGVLRDYQIRGYSWLHYLTCNGIGACLADDMGLGKTIQFIALLLSRSMRNDTKPWILICPTSLVGNWIHEIKKFSPSVRLMVHHGASRLEGENFVHDAENHDLVISTYSLIQRDLETLSKTEWGVIALDEAQNIKNHYTKQSQTIKSLRSDMRIALTGTPIENRLSELWSIIDFLNPGYLYGIEEFRQKFSIPIERYRDTTKQTELQRLVKPLILRRVKTDPSIISDLPQKMEMKVYCSLTQEQATLYEAVVEQMMQNIEDSKGIKRKGIVLGALTRLKQICDHPSLYLADESANLDSRSGKLSRLKEMLEEIIEIGENSLVFTQYAGMGMMIKKYIQSSLGCETFFLHGSVPRKERDLMIKRFQEGIRTSDNKKSSKVFVLSIKAGGVGLNLTAANHVFHYDRWWNPAVENQATDRTYRIGQNKTVQIHKFISTGTLEEKIDEMIERKKGLAEGIIETGEKWITQMNNEQLRQIFTLRREVIVKEK